MNIKVYFAYYSQWSLFKQKNTMQKISCQVSKIEPLTNVVSRVLLTPESPLEFIAGQYLQVVMGDQDKRPFSIANAPQQDGAIELHIGAEPGNQYAGQVLEKMRSEGKIEVEGGLGDAFLKLTDVAPEEADSV